MQPVIPTVTGISSVAFWPAGIPPKYNSATFFDFSNDVSAACSPLMANVSFTLSDALQWSDIECDMACSNLGKKKENHGRDYKRFFLSYYGF